MHIALVCPDVPGHLNPATTLGRELAHRGHRVSLMSTPFGRPWADRGGLGFLPVGRADEADGSLAAAQARLGELSGFRAMQYTGRLLAAEAEAVLRDAPAALKAAGVDGLIVDQVSPAGAAVADALGLPFAVACAALAVNQEPGVPPPVTAWAYRDGPLARARNRLGNQLLQFAARPVFAAVNRFRAAHRLHPIGLGLLPWSGLAQVAQQPAFFDFPRQLLPDHFHYTGPWHTPDRDAAIDFPWDRLDGRPLVYASLGTLQNRLAHAFRAIAEACAGLDVQLLLSLGNRGAAWDGPTPANALVVPFAPQLRLLDRAAVAVTHAGLNTALECLARGVPMACVPITNDQPGVARRVQWLGAGEVVLPRRATAARLRELIRAVLSDPKYRAAAGDCRQMILASPGLPGAADVVERALTTGQRVPFDAFRKVIPDH